MLQPTDIVIAKVKGYPPWPAMVIPFEIIPQQVLTKNRSKLPDDSDTDSDGAEYIEYSPMLTFKKFTHELTNYCVKFFHDDSYIWLNPRNLHELTLPQVESFLAKANSKTSKNLVAAYEMAKQGLTTGIDVWEFVEYGSEGKPDDEDYTEGENDDEEEYAEETNSSWEKAPKRKATRSSTRTSAKKTKVPKRSTRSRSKASSKNDDNEDDNDLDSAENDEILSDIDDEDSSEEPVSTKKSKNSSKNSNKTKAKSNGGSKAKASVTTTSKSKAAVAKPNKPKPKPKPEIYHYEDDIDWKIVGLGPQDLDLDSHPSFVSKLLTKKNLEIHNDLKLELKDRLSAVNKMLIEYTLDKNDDPDLVQLIIDELSICLSLKGNHDELWTVFLSNSELLLNYRILLNLKRQELEEVDALDKFLETYEEIYDHPFQFDSQKWDRNAQIIKTEEKPKENGEGEVSSVSASV